MSEHVVKSARSTRESTGRRVAWAMLVAGALVFAALASSYDDDPLAAWDEEAARWIAAHSPAALEVAARPLSWLGGWWGGVILVGLVLAHHAWSRTARTGNARVLDHAFVLAALVGASLLGRLAKLPFDRPRPTVDPVVELPASSAFPSGHATTGVALLGAVALVVIPRLESHAARAGVTVGAVTVGLAIGLSRLALGVHWVTDVFAGWCLGLAWLALCVLVRDWSERRPGGHVRP